VLARSSFSVAERPLRAPRTQVADADSPLADGRSRFGGAASRLDRRLTQLDEPFAWVDEPVARLDHRSVRLAFFFPQWHDRFARVHRLPTPSEDEVRSSLVVASPPQAMLCPSLEVIA